MTRRANGVRTLIYALTILAAGSVFAQEDGPDKDEKRQDVEQADSKKKSAEDVTGKIFVDSQVNLDDLPLLLRMAERNNPEINVARTEVTMAEAEFERTRSDELRHVALLHAEREQLKNVLDVTEKLVETGRGDVKELADVKLRYASVESELRHAIGALSQYGGVFQSGGPLNQKVNIDIRDMTLKSAVDLLLQAAGIENVVEDSELTGNVSSQLQNVSLEQAINTILGAQGLRLIHENGAYRITRNRFAGSGASRPKIEDLKDTDTVRALQNGVGLVFEDIPLSEIANFITKTYELNVVIDAGQSTVHLPYIKVVDVSLLDALHALADQNGICFIIRDYGIFATTPDRAESIPGPSIPEGIPYYPQN